MCSWEPGPSTNPMSLPSVRVVGAIRNKTHLLSFFNLIKFQGKYADVYSVIVKPGV